MRRKSFFTTILVMLLIFTSINVNTFAEEVNVGRDIKDVIGADENGDDYNMLVAGDLVFVDKDGKPLDSITKDATASLNFEFNIESQHLNLLKNGDYFDFNLPDIFKVSMPLTGNLSDSSGTTFGSYHIGVDGKVRINFTNVDDIDLADLTGHLELKLSLDADQLENSGNQKVTLPVKDEIEYEFVIEPINKINGISKSGKVDRELNPEYITWEVLINRDFRDLTNVVVEDILPEGLTLEDVEVLPYIMSLSGEFVGYGDVIDPSSNFYTQEGSNVLFPNIKTPFAIRYKTRIKDNYKPDEGGDIVFENSVSLKADNADKIGTKHTVSAKYGVLLNKKQNPTYNGNDNSITGRPGAQTFTWNIEYNYGDKTISNPTLVDTFDANLEYVPNSMVLKYKDGSVVSPDDYSVVTSGNTLEIRFNKEVNRAIDISYKTAVKEGVLITGDSKFSNSVTTGGKTSGSFGTASPQLIKKTSPSIDYNAKRITWKIDININRYDIKNYSVEDKYINTNKGLTFTDGSLEIKDMDFKPVKTLVLDRDYSFEKLYENGIETGYRIVFIGDYAETNHMLSIGFKTDYDTRVLAAKEDFVNRAVLTWTDKSNVKRSHHSDANRSPNAPARNNGQKNGIYDYNSKIITWTSEVNYNGNPLKNSKIEDIMLNGQQFIMGSLEIRPYNVAANGSITRGNVLPLNGFTIEYPTVKNGQKLTILLPDGNEKYSISYKTSVEGELILSQYDNTLVFSNDGDIDRAYTNHVRPPRGGVTLNKSGKQNGALINWKIEINGSQSTIEEAVLKDIPSNNQFYLEDTFKLFPVNYKGDSYDILRNSPLVEGIDYLLIFHKDVEGNLSFEIQFLATIDKMFVLEYDTQISTTKEDTLIKNKVELTGKNVKYSNQNDSSKILINVDSAGGGAVGTRGSLSLRKLGEKGVVLEGVVFELYKNGKKIATETTNADGIVHFRRLIHGDYVIKEVRTQDGYVISDDLFNGKTYHVNTVTSTQGHLVDVKNEKSKLTINKLGADNKLLAGSRFKLLKEIDGVYEVIEQSLDVVSGSVTLEGVSSGKYRLVELGTPSDYILNTKPLDFEIMEDRNGQVISKTVDFTNYKGSVKLVKSDERGLLAGAKFDLYHNGLKLKEGLVTDSKGEINLVNTLSPGNYYFKETASAGGNIVNPNEIHFVISDKSVGKPTSMLVTATNYKGTVTFNKVDESGNALSGALFELWNTDKNALVATVASDVEGRVTVNQVDVGNYEFREIQAADGFVINSKPIKFKIDSSTANGRHDLELEDFVNYKGAVRLNKYDESKNLLGGVVFDLYTKEGTLVAEGLKTEFGTISVNELSPGAYYFIETATVGGNIRYTGKIEFEIPTSMEGVAAVVVNFLNTKASVTFNKVDVFGEGVEGATFKLVDANGKTVATTTSLEDGTVFVDGLVPGAYTFVEIDPANGYILNGSKIAFTVAAESADQKLEIVLDDFVNYKGSVQLTKYDELGVLEGALFDLYKEDGSLVYADLTTDVSGVISIEHDLVPGKYYFVETASANGNLINPTRIAFEVLGVVDGAPQLITLVASNAKGKVVFTKESADGNPLAGAIFALVDLGTDTVILSGIESDENGLIEVDGLAPGKYAFIETKAVDGYLLNETLHSFEIPTFSTEDKYVKELEVYVNYKGSVSLTKTDESGVLEGAIFDIYDAADNLVIEGLVTDSNGVIEVINELAPGKYYFVEKASANGNVINTNAIPFEIVESATGAPEVVEVQAHNTKASVTFKKVDMNGDPLSGVIFVLKNIDTGEEVARPISDENGIVFVDGLVPGNYEFIEWFAQGYIINSTSIEFNIPEESELVKVELELADFSNYKGSVVLSKFDELGLLEGAVFDLYTDDNVLIYENLVTDENGEIVILNELAPGHYYFKEVASANGNIVNETPISFVIASAWEGVPEVVEVIATNAKGSVSFYKVDESGKAIANVLFELINLETNEVVATVLSDETGHVFVDHLTPGSYAFKEVEAADGFILNTAVIEFVIPESSFDDKFELVLDDFVNYKGGLVVKKTDSKGKLLDGAKFVLKDKDGNIVASFVANHGTAMIEGLIPGSYTLTEVSAPKGYKLSSEVFEIVIPESYEGAYVSEELKVVNVLQDPVLPSTGFTSYLLYSAMGAVLLGFVLILVSKRKYS